MFRFFIEHPRFSLVISLVILIAGIIAVRTLPVEKFPDLSPPIVEVSASYPGASAEVVEQTVTALLEEEINGVPGMLSIDSVSSNDGKSKIRVTFEVGSDVDQKSVLVQNRVQKAIPRLPQEVRREGVVVEAASSSMLAVVNLWSENPEQFDELFLSNYALLNVRDVLARVPGIGRAEILGAREYGMRVWLDPDRLRTFNLSANEVADAIIAQNLQLAGGRIGAAPAPADQRYQFSVLMPGRLASAEEFGAVILRTESDGSVLRLRDVADVELGAQNYDVTSKLNGQPTASIVLYQLPGSNALAAVDGVEAEMQRLSDSFPAGIRWQLSYDSTEVVDASIDEMLITLYIAVALVMLVVLVFLGGVRPTLVPGVAVPVSLIGTFALMSALGFSLNTLSLFGLILAIGIVVDDAILVVETTTRNIEEHGMQPKPAAIAAMAEVGGAVIASTLVLLAVFVPVAFIPGLTGRLFQQFALTISAAVCISTVNALTLSPALSSLILARPNTPPTALARWFNRYFQPLRERYVGVVRLTLARKLLAPLVILAVLLATGTLTRVVPSGFVPLEDEGVLMMQVSLPDAASTNRTEEVCQQITRIALGQDEVADVIAFSGYDLLAGAVSSNKGLIIVVLDDWSARPDPTQHVQAVKARLAAATHELLDASVFTFQMPPIPGLGTTAGLDFELQNRGGLDAGTLSEIAQDLATNAGGHPAIAQAVVSFTADVPQIRVALDREQTSRLDVPLRNVQDTLSSNLAARYIDDVVLFGRTFRVMMSSRSGSVAGPTEMLELTTRTSRDALVPLGTVADVELEGGPSFVTRFNLYPSARITVIPAPGFSSSEAIAAMEAIAAATLGPDFGYQWSGQAREERTSAGASTAVLMLSVVFVFLFLTAQYESFTTPIAVMLMVPTAMFGAYLAQLIAGLPIDLYTRVGLVLLVGLTAKTAILLVELAKQQVDGGEAVERAAEQAAKLRFRAVLMTAGTFILGMLPLLMATGAGAASRVSLGSAVTGGTIAGVVFT
ncbi:MAG TPA: efflux RND transporter permease subunit, partial [Enhygromyxa sp.]|nr:efflux RND transporter permease subunit [Enhygromyxa sp.]